MLWWNPTPSCGVLFCNRPGHSKDTCYTKERADRTASKPQAAYASTTRPPSTFLAEGGNLDEQGVRYESAFMAIAGDYQYDSLHSELPSLTEAVQIPSLIDILGSGSTFCDPSTPIRYLGLCCGANMHFIRSLILRGRFFAELYLGDKDLVARQVALATLQRLAGSYPESFAPTVRLLAIHSSKLFQ